MQNPLQSVIFHYIKFPPAGLRLICHRAGAAKTPGFPPRAAAPWQSGCAAGSEQGLRFPSSRMPWLSRLKAFSHRTTWGQLHFDLALMYICERHTDTFLRLFRIWGPGLRSEHSWTQNVNLPSSCGLRHPDPQEMWMRPCSQATLVMTHTQKKKNHSLILLVFRNCIWPALFPLSCVVDLQDEELRLLLPSFWQIAKITNHCLLRTHWLFLTSVP